MHSDPSPACKFCTLALGGLPRRSTDTTWSECEHSVAVVSIGALVPGWTLIVPRAHELNMSAGLASDALHSFLKTTVARIESVFGSRPTLFEHGCAFEESITGCGVGHAHLHLVPLDFQLSRAAINFDCAREWIECSLAEVASIARNREYLFVCDRYDDKHSRGFLCVLENSVSQFFRKVIARQLGRDAEFDYRVHEQTDTVLQSLRMLTAPAEMAA